MIPHVFKAAGIALLVLLGLGFLVQAGSLPTEATEAHKYADGVLLHRFTAAVNDWQYQHPQDKSAGTWDHVHTLNRGDAERWKTVRQSFRELDEAMKRAGF